MNVYDFDKTIYDGDSTLDFYLYCLKKQPLLILYIPTQIISFLFYKLGFINKLRFKEFFYGFLKWINNPEGEVDSFWDINKRKIKSWYLNQKETTDVIISASPEFLLQPICQKLSVKLIASKVDINTGRCLSENCYGLEKVNRFNLNYEKNVIKKFYSDSLTDEPMAMLAERSFFVNGNEIVEWANYNQIKKKPIFFNIEFFLFIIIGVINTFNGVLFAYFFSSKFNHIIAFILGYLVSLLFSYILNSFVVFKSGVNFLKFIKFAISYIPNFAIQLLMVVIFLQYFGLHQLVVYILTAIIAVPVTFLILKVFAFK